MNSGMFENNNILKGIYTLYIAYMVQYATCKMSYNI